MAGIGFEIRKLIDEQTFESDWKAYFFAGIITSGPWLISIMGLGLLWMLANPYFGMSTHKLVRVVVVYTYSYSLILTGFIQFVLSRFLSDKLFLKQKRLFLPAYAGIIILTTVFSGIIAVAFYSLCDVDLVFKLIGIILFIAVSCIWQTMVFLSASRDYGTIVAAFIGGNIIGLIGGVVLSRYLGMHGYLLGFTIGQVGLYFLLMWKIFYEFRSNVSYDFEFLLYTKKYADLFFVGVFYYLAIWVDKIIYWYSKEGEHILSLFYSQYPYDSCMFLAFLTIMPVMAQFVIEIETSFYDAYKNFYGSIVSKGAFWEIERKKNEMVRTVNEAFSRIFMLQTIVTVTFLCYSYLLIGLLNIQREYVFVLIAGAIGAYFHVFLLVSMILILYFDRRRAALVLTLFFLVTNTLFTQLVIRYVPNLMGVGYAVSTFLSALLALFMLYSIIQNIEYVTFAEQPILSPRLSKPGKEA